MNVWIEINPLAQSERTGIANYLFFWLRALLAEAPRDNFTLWAPEVDENPFPASANAHFQGRRAFPRWTRAHYEALWTRRDLGGVPPNAHIYHLPFFARPAPRRANTKLIVTVYDLAFAYYPEVVVDLPFFRYLSDCFVAQCEQADHFIAISQSTKHDLQTVFGVPEDKITVIYPGNDLSLPSESQMLPRALQSQLPARYILCAGTWEPRKNLPNLFRAIARLAPKLREQNVKLCLSGGRGWKIEEAERLLDDLQLQDVVVRLGYVPREVLPSLYARALFLVYPSLYEGFGLPVLEAMVCGCPVITSNVSSLPEVVGEAGLMVDPHNVDELAAAMERLLDDAVLRDDLRERGLAQAQTFSWENAARQTLDVYKSLTAGR